MNSPLGTRNRKNRRSRSGRAVFGVDEICSSIIYLYKENNDNDNDDDEDRYNNSANSNQFARPDNSIYPTRLYHIDPFRSRNRSVTCSPKQDERNGLNQIDLAKRVRGGKKSAVKSRFLRSHEVAKKEKRKNTGWHRRRESNGTDNNYDFNRSDIGVNSNTQRRACVRGRGICISSHDTHEDVVKISGGVFSSRDDWSGASMERGKIRRRWIQTGKCVWDEEEAAWQRRLSDGWVRARRDQGSRVYEFHARR